MTALSLETVASAANPIDLVEEIVQANEWAHDRASDEELVIEIAGPQFENNRGNLCLIDHRKVVAASSLEAPIDRTIVRIPRAMLIQRIGPPERFIPLRVDGATGVGAMMTSMLCQLPERLPAISASARERIAENVTDLIAAALLSAADRPPASARVTLTRVKFWIETHLAENLCGEEIARRRAA